MKRELLLCFSIGTMLGVGFGLWVSPKVDEVRFQLRPLNQEGQLVDPTEFLGTLYATQAQNLIVAAELAAAAEGDEVEPARNNLERVRKDMQDARATWMMARKKMGQKTWPSPDLFK